MKENNTEKKISIESAKQIAEHLSAVLKNPDIPADLYNAIAEGVCEMKNLSPLCDAARDDEPEEIEKVLIAHINKEVLDEPKSLSSYTLPELLSAAFNHPDMIPDLRVDLWNALNDHNVADMDSVAYLALMLGLKGQSKTAEIKSSFPKKLLRTAFSTGFAEAKGHLDFLVDMSQHEPEFFRALILLLGVVIRTPNLDKDDLLIDLQRYLFAYTRSFDVAADEYIEFVEKTGNPSEPELPDEPNENEPNESESGGNFSMPYIEPNQTLEFKQPEGGLL